MRGYSLDLRLKVLAAVDRGIPRKEVVRTLGVSRPTLERYLSLRRQTGEIGPHGPPDVHLSAPPSRSAAHCGDSSKRTTTLPWSATASCGRASKGTGFPSLPCGEPCASWGGRKKGAVGSLRARRSERRCLARAPETSQFGFVTLIGVEL